MRELNTEEVSEVSGGAIPLAALAVKGIAWFGATVGAAAAAYYASEFVSNS